MFNSLLWDSLAFPDTIAALLAGYLAGSVPFGLLLTAWLGLGDIRKLGSGNIGATNVLRTGRKGLALATLICDGGKGALAVLLVGSLGGSALLAGAGAVLGHLFPLWLRFRGGKGVATSFGVLLALNGLLGLCVLAIWLLVALLSESPPSLRWLRWALCPLWPGSGTSP